MLFLYRETAAADPAASPRLTTLRTVVDWTFSLAFAALLAAAIWKLDDAPWHRLAPHATASQAQPEGWALWSGDLPASTRPPAAQPASASAEAVAR